MKKINFIENEKNNQILNKLKENVNNLKEELHKSRNEDIKWKEDEACVSFPVTIDIKSLADYVLVGNVFKEGKLYKEYEIKARYRILKDICTATFNEIIFKEKTEE